MSVKLSHGSLSLRYSDDAIFTDDWPAVLARVSAHLDSSSQSQPNSQVNHNGVVMRERRTQSVIASVTLDELEGTIKDQLLTALTSNGCPMLLAIHIASVVYEEIRETDLKSYALHPNSEFEEIYEDVMLLNGTELVRHAIHLAVQRCVTLSRMSGDVLADRVGLRTQRVRDCLLDTSVYAIKNSRKKMEDRHLILTNIDEMYRTSVPDLAQSLFGVFDGHAGVEAAQYAAAQLPIWLVRGKRFASDVEQAFHDAFGEADSQFCTRARRERLKCGSTALCALIRERRLYVAWAGDSQALLLRAGKGIELTEPHKPERADERRRIEEQNGVVLFLNGWRVNGTLSVSRAIGDVDQKPYVSAEPDVRAVDLTDHDDFLILACDGLWDTVTADLAARTVYEFLSTPSNHFDDVAQKLVTVAQQRGSSDNISCLVVKLRARASIMADFNADSAPMFGMPDPLTGRAVSAGASHADSFASGCDERDSVNGGARIKKSLVKPSGSVASRSSFSRGAPSGTTRRRAVVPQHPRRSNTADSDDDTLTETEAAAARSMRDSQRGRASSLTLEAVQAIRRLKLDEKNTSSSSSSSGPSSSTAYAAAASASSSKSRRTHPATANPSEKRKLSFS